MIANYEKNKLIFTTAFINMAYNPMRTSTKNCQFDKLAGFGTRLVHALLSILLKKFN